MGILETLKGAFVETVPDPEEKPGQASSPVPPTVPAIPTAVRASQPGAPPRPADAALIESIDKAAREQLGAALEGSGANLVRELGDLLDSLREAIPDPKAAHKAAIKVLLKKGNTISGICSDYDKCIGVLEGKDREFAAQLKSQFDKRVGSRSKLVEDCGVQMATKKAQVEQLQAEIAELSSKSSEAQSEILEEQSKLQLAQSRFTAGYKALRAQIESQRAETAQYGEKS